MSTVFQRHADLRLTAIAGEGVVLHLGAKRYFTVNETGLCILNALEAPRTLEQLIDSVCAEFEVDRLTAADTTKAFLDHCLKTNVVAESPGG